MAIRKFFKAESRGSLIPFSFGFFLLAMSLSFISINIASAYLVKKELTNVAESAVNKSAQSINTLAYYSQLNRFSNIKRVPLIVWQQNIKFH
jgi:Flp pilus assembly protein TadG